MDDPITKIVEDLVAEVFGRSWADTADARWVRARARQLARRAFVDGLASGRTSDE